MLKDEQNYIRKDDYMKESNNKFIPYSVMVNINNLNIRKGPSSDAESLGFCPMGVNKIIKEVNSYGKLEGQPGWINLDFVTKIAKEDESDVQLS